MKNNELYILLDDCHIALAASNIDSERYNHLSSRLIAQKLSLIQNDTKLSEEDLISIGFERIPHFTVNRAMIYKLGRNRHLSIGDTGTPNETLFICESDKDDYRKITDLVCLHNYDYDGYLSKSKLETLIKCLGITRKQL